MDETCNIERLPLEIIHRVLSVELLNYRDVLSFSCTSHFLRNITKSNCLWKRKFFQAIHRQRVIGLYNDSTDIDWLNELMNRVKIGQSVRSRLDLMGITCRSIIDLTYRQFDPFLAIAEVHPRGIEFVIDELMSIINDSERGSNLTQKFYGSKILRFMQQYKLSSLWGEIECLREDKQILERGAFFIGQWQYPEVDVLYEDLNRSLNYFTRDVMDILQKKNFGRHPVFNVDQEVRKLWRETILDGNKWHIHECRQILSAISSLLFEHKGFKVEANIYQNLSINKELSMGECDPLIMAIIYEGIARRLGVKCCLFNLGSNFMLGWSESYSQHDSLDPYPQYFIDFLNSGNLIPRTRCQTLECLEFSGKNDALYEDCKFLRLETTMKMVRCIANQMVLNCMQNEAHTFDHVSGLRSALELVLVTEPDQFNSFIQLMVFYDINGIDIDPKLYDRLENFLPNLNPQQKAMFISFINSRRKDTVEYLGNKELDELDVPPKRRDVNNNVKYAIGLIMQHKNYGYKCVIYGWDYECAASQNWIQTMRVHRLEHKEFQPFYNVLVDDGSLRYAAQENLKLVEYNHEIEVPEVGRYFEKWCGRYYTPTLMKTEEYPDDEGIRNAIIDCVSRE